MMTCVCRLGFLMACLASVGCRQGRVEEPTYPVRGTVTLDEKPLPEGEVYFVNASVGSIDVIPIKDGQFTGQAKAGNRQIQVFAYREGPPVAEMPGMEPKPTRENYIPVQYNTESKLNAEVKAVQPPATNEFKFELKSQ